MTLEQFENLRENFLVHEARILDWKRNEYSSTKNNRKSPFRGRGNTCQLHFIITRGGGTSET